VEPFGIIVGEAPGPGQPDGSVFTGPSGDRLTRLLGRPWRRCLVGYNLLGNRQRLGPGGSEFPAREAAAAARVLADASPWFGGGRAVLLAGKRVAAAFGLREPEYFRVERIRIDRWTSGGGADMWERSVVAVVVPHPSGRCRWWNDPRNRRRASRWFRRLAEERGF
jgi:uracil-DNA glycosylase